MYLKLGLSLTNEYFSAFLFSASGVCPDSPFILHPSTNARVFVVPDPSHLLKNTRNCLKQYDIEFEPGRVAQWKWFSALCHLEFAAELRLCPKLKQCHLDLPVGLNMKVNIAAQTLSFSAAAAIRCYVQLGKLSADSLDTADFLEKMNTCFDLVNSSSAQARDPTRVSVSRVNLLSRKADFKALINWISKWKIIRRMDGQVMQRHEFPLGWRVALSSLGQLATLCLRDGLEYLSLRRFGQDHIENLFCVIRGRNGYNDRPEYRPFQSAMRSAALSNLLRPLTSASNCEADDDNMLTSVLLKRKKVACVAGASSTAALQSEPESDEEDEDDLTEVVENYHLFTSEIQAISYVGGYIVQKLQWKKKINCDECVAALVSSVSSKFVQLKQFDYEDCAQLLTPSQQLLAFLRSSEVTFRRHITHMAHRANVGATLRRRIYKNAPPLRVCEGHHVSDCVLTLFLRIRLHHWCKLTNQSLKSVREAKRKAKKQKKLGC